MRILSIGIVFTLAAACFADTVTLKSGRVINGTYLGGSARQVRLDAGDRIETLDVSDIARIEFSSAPEPAPAAESRPVLRRDNVMRPDAGAPRRLLLRGPWRADRSNCRPGRTLWCA